jgi:hypothetical protein
VLIYYAFSGKSSGDRLGLLLLFILALAPINHVLPFSPRPLWERDLKGEGHSGILSAVVREARRERRRGTHHLLLSPSECVIIKGRWCDYEGKREILHVHLW